MTDIAKLLKNAQYGLELYSTIFGVVYLKGVNDNLTIAVYDKNKIARYFNKYGQYFDGFDDAECQLFPAKGQSWDEWKHIVELAKTSFNVHRFKIGDWIISKDKNRIYQITDIRGKKYFYDNTAKYDYINIADDLYDLWTIQDAKPGDILVANGAPFIYKSHDNNYVFHYCGINLGDEFVVSEKDNSIWNSNTEITPANQMQWNSLFRKMEDVGYVWDPDKKVLSKKTKFKVGDWIISDHPDAIFKVGDLKKTTYKLIDIYGDSHDCQIIEVDKNYHLWSVQDAKPGDILVDNAKGFTNPLIFILKKFEHVNYGLAKPSDYSSYCFLTASDDQRFKEGHFHHMHDIKPATQEQKDLLFSKMDEAGYTWDSKNKKLTKKAKFKIGDWIIRNDGYSDVPVQIYNLKKDRYLVTNMLGSKGDVMLTWQDKWHIWTINDARPGDILNANGAVFIYKKHNKDYVYHYCGINLGNEFVIGTDDSIWNANNEIYPATQEQKDLLFKRIKETGYIWDLNSNTLTKKTKFKIGDWITDGICKAKIIDIDNKYYWYSKNSMLGEIESIDKEYHIWTIDDAKPGDILCYKDEISIYKNNLMDFLDRFTGFQYYCCYDGKVLVTNGFYSLTEKKDKFDIYPATEEQIETLFSYMTPAGYIWDFNNKTLKETKFKIGNWIVNNVDKSIGQITEIICDRKDPNTLYGYEHTNGFFANDFEDNYHLWNINDAKHGDVLHAKIDGDDYILLFKQIKDGWIETYGHYYDSVNRFCAPTQLFCRDYQGTFSPATEKQRKLLFSKMKESGYSWNPNKKTLNNRNTGEQHYDISNFKAGMPVLVRDKDNQKWCYLLYSHYDNTYEDELCFNAGSVDWRQCIPYEGNETLVGTPNPCKKKYINWNTKK